MCREYHQAYRKLTPENRQVIRKMRYYLDSHYLNQVYYDALMNDIVGMALESQSRGERFSDTVGIAYQDFCDELVKNTLRQGPWERLLGALVWMFGYIGLIVPFMYLFSLFFNLADVTYEGILLVTPMELVFKYLFIVCALNIGWVLVKRSIYKSSTIVVGCFLSFITLTVIFADYITMNVWRQRETIHVNILIWMATLTAVVLLLLLIKTVVAQYRAKKEHNG